MPSPASPASVAELLAAFGAAMREASLRWYVYGGQAVLAYGVPRFTADVDITVDLAARPPAELLAVLAAHGFGPRFPLSDDLLASLRLLPIEHVESGIPIDLVLAAPGIEQEFLERARLVDLGGARVPVISPEDLIAAKILAGRRKDLEDARGIVARQEGRLDLERSRAVLAAFEEALGDRGLSAKLEALLRRPVKKKRPPSKQRKRR